MSLSFGGGHVFPVSLILLAAVVVYVSENYKDSGLMPWAGVCVLVAIMFQIVWLYIVSERTKNHP